MKLALFFTRDVSLKQWLDSGLFDREKLIYEEHLGKGSLDKVYWLTYGKDDTKVGDKLKAKGRLHPDILVLAMPRFFCGAFGHLLYSFVMLLIHRRLLKGVDIFKTNQMDGSWSAVIAKWLYKKPLIARTGYTLSLTLKKKAKSRLKIKISECIERFIYKHADVGVVASCRNKQYICSVYTVPSEKIKVLHNYINTKLFKPTSCKKYTDRIVFVGRLAPEKNLFNLFEAVSITGFTLDIYGRGELRQPLEHKAGELSVPVNFMGIVPNNEMPGVLNRYRYFILPSLYEAMPKTLLEAMACGLVCIGTDAEGINEIIEDRVNGYLAKGTDVESLTAVIKKATHLPCEIDITKGIRKIRNKFSIETIGEREKELFRSLKL